MDTHPPSLAHFLCQGGGSPLQCSPGFQTVSLKITLQKSKQRLRQKWASELGPSAPRETPLYRRENRGSVIGSHRPGSHPKLRGGETGEGAGVNPQARLGRAPHGLQPTDSYSSFKTWGLAARGPAPAPELGAAGLPPPRTRGGRRECGVVGLGVRGEVRMGVAGWGRRGHPAGCPGG